MALTDSADRALAAERVAGLAKVKLQGLVRGAFPAITAEPESFNAGVGLAQGAQAFVYLIEQAPSPLAAALAWGDRRGATELHVVVDQPDPMLAAMVGGLDPAPALWQAVGATLQPMPSDGLSKPAEPGSQVLAQQPLLETAGCDVVSEHGVVIGEVLGLEVARVVLELDGSTSVRVGVGLYDQEAHALMHAESSVEDRLDQVIGEVRKHRTIHAGPHPLNRVARERWLRSLAVADPSLVELDELAALAPLEPRGGIHEQRPVAALGSAGTDDVLVVFSTGIDLDLVPMAAAYVARHRPHRVMLVLPARDHHDIIPRMASHLAVPATLSSIPDPWPH